MRETEMRKQLLEGGDVLRGAALNDFKQSGIIHSSREEWSGRG